MGVVVVCMSAFFKSSWLDPKENLAVFLTVRSLGVSSSYATWGSFEVNSVSVASSRDPFFSSSGWEPPVLVCSCIHGTDYHHVKTSLSSRWPGSKTLKNPQKPLVCRSFFKLTLSPTEAVTSRCTWRFFVNKQEQLLRKKMFCWDWSD